MSSTGRGRAATTILAAIGASVATTAWGQDRAIETPAGEAACALGAFVTETDPAGLNVRSGPGTGFGIVGRLPPVTISKEIDQLAVMVEVEITAGAKGWFRIRKARDNTQLTGAPARPMFSGQGWVSGQKLAVKTQAVSGHAGPDGKTAVLVAAAKGETLDNDGLRAASRLIGCKGKWALVEYGPIAADADLGQKLEIAPRARAGLPEGRFRSWVDRICAIQETSCSGF